MNVESIVGSAPKDEMVTTVPLMLSVNIVYSVNDEVVVVIATAALEAVIDGTAWGFGIGLGTGSDKT